MDHRKLLGLYNTYITWLVDQKSIVVTRTELGLIYAKHLLAHYGYKYYLSPSLSLKSLFVHCAYCLSTYNTSASYKQRYRTEQCVSGSCMSYNNNWYGLNPKLGSIPANWLPSQNTVNTKTLHFILLLLAKKRFENVKKLKDNARLLKAIWQIPKNCISRAKTKFLKCQVWLKFSWLSPSYIKVRLVSASFRTSFSRLDWPLENYSLQKQIICTPSYLKLVTQVC